MEKFFLDAITSLSLLKLPWFILVLGLVIGLEALVFHYYWKNWIRSIEISVCANIVSTLIAVPFLLIPGGPGSLWVFLIVAASNINEYEISEYNVTGIIFYVWAIVVFLFLFIIAFIVSVLIEIYIGKILQAPEERRRTIFTNANLVTYSTIIVTLIGLGIWFGITNQDPNIDNWDFLKTYFVHTVPIDSPLDFFYPLTLLISILTMIFLLVWNFYRSSMKKSISQPLE